ncbi:MAG: ribosome silencing factor [Candidatus Acididesulfobacter guangdongensis]|uniref:Ribosomal silencing factor RsfS n=1 Tax=Acididesulfobacter guangdongensis TaxID=2597225 RepID=A0A519BI38_ACIG2|nr:MAG: ribosome silencing factor [Candidatus Acididesulfobacter guangdongensis]
MNSITTANIDDSAANGKKVLRKKFKRTSKEIRAVINYLSDKKAKNIIVLDIRKVSQLADFIIIATGISDRQVAAIADNVLTSVKRKPIAVDGTDTSRWVAMDYGDMMIHIFVEPYRSFYNLENLWPDAKELAIEDK